MITNTQSVADRLNRQWWLAEEGKEHERLMPLRERLQRQDADRRQTVLKHMRMYGGFGPSKNVLSKPDRLRYNVVEQAVDTLLAEISTNKPKAAFLTTGGDWTLRQGAKECELVTEAQMRASGLYSGLARQVLRDAEVCSVGFVEVYIDWDTLTPKAERGLWNELLIDEADGRYGKPRTITRQHLIDRGVALARYGTTSARKKAIEDAPRFSSADQADEWMMNPAEFNESDLILVVKSWHLASSSKAKDGRFAVCIDGATLWSEPYTRTDRFPLILLRWGEELVGPWGKSVVGQLEADQVELNRTLRRIQEAAGVAAGLWMLDRAAKVRQRHLTDLPGTAVEYSGSKPEYVTPGTVPMDLVNHALGIIDRALQRIGVSQMFASAMKPAGLNSGEAQRVHSNIFSQRQIEHTDAWEAWHVDVARAFVDANLDIANFLAHATDKQKREIPEVNVEVKRGRKTVLKRMRFKEQNLPENAFVLQAYPMSSLPSEPSGRQATIGDWISLGLIDQTDARALLRIPDTESFMDLKLADYDFALWAFESMVEDGEYVSPEPYQKLDLGLELVRVSYLRAVIDGVPDERLDLVRDHMAAIKRLIEKAMPPAASAAVDPMAAASAVPPDAAAAALPAPELAGLDSSTLPVAA